MLVEGALSPMLSPIIAFVRGDDPHTGAPMQLAPLEGAPVATSLWTTGARYCCLRVPSECLG